MSQPIPITTVETRNQAATAIRVKTRPGIVRIVFQRPGQGNALNLALAREALAALRAAEEDPDVQVLTLTGEGRYFCAGGDVYSMAALAARDRPAYLAQLAGAAHELALAIVRSRLLVIAAVNGAAAGAGLGLVLCADWVLVDESAPLVAAYASIGLSPDTGVSYFLPRVLGHQRAVELTLGGRKLDGEQAVDWSLANEAVSSETFAPRLAELEDGFVRGAVQAIGPTKSLLRAGVAEELEAHLHAEASSIARLSEHPDSVRLVNRFAGK
ncbi:MULTISPECIES: enoyl-CoA hydratase/isomerase family protein [unclassified Arthrobacter]|uniref:enoyl-CoA hydratase/isomerase family protein n=1 Tax=unclassified Arthrobacter TaxID=235627 RepID=UPI002157DF6F|nr:MULTISPECIES: enoyl-CoA hydratase/isomerase family protein [unclassified Arthrobacter]